MVESDLRQALLRLAWPAVLATGATAAFSIIDSIFVGRGLGSVALAAVTTSSFVLWSVDSMTLGVSVGMTALVARRVGAQDAEGSEQVVRQGLSLAVLAALVIGVIGWLTCPAIFRAMGVASDVAVQGVAYLRVLFVGVSSLFVFHAVEAAFRGAGDTRTPLCLLLGAVGLNVIVDPLLILGLGPFPRLGVPGAALATVIAHGVSSLVGLVLLWRRGLLVVRAASDWSPRVAAWWSILRVGLPSAANGVFFCAVLMVIARFTAQYGTDVVAALGVGHRGEAPSYFLGLGFGLAVAPLVGQSLGAGMPERAERAAWLAVRFALVWGLPWMLILVFAPRLVASVFIDDAAVVNAAGSYLFILAWSQLLMVMELVLDGAFAGAGDTFPPMAVGLPLAAARIPLAWWLGSHLGFGAEGIWWGISATSILRGILIALWFRWGRWKRRQLG